MTDVNKELDRFKESLHAHFDAFPIPTQLGIIAIMKHIEKVYAEFSSAASPQPSPTAVVLDDERDAARWRFVERNAVPNRLYASGNPVWQFHIRGESIASGVDVARAASPQPVAQPVEQTRALTDEQRSALNWAINQCEWSASHRVRSYGDALRALLTAARPASGETD